MPSLILQRTSNKCEMFEVKSHTEMRLNLWKNKDVESLLNETRMIQERLPQWQKQQAAEEKAKRYAWLVLEGKWNAAIQRLVDDYSSGVLRLSVDMIKTFCQNKADGKPSNDTMLHGSFNHAIKIIFDAVDADLARKCAIRTEGLYGP